MTGKQLREHVAYLEAVNAEHQKKRADLTRDNADLATRLEFSKMVIDARAATVEARNALIEVRDARIAELQSEKNAQSFDLEFRCHCGRDYRLVVCLPLGCRENRALDYIGCACGKFRPVGFDILRGK